jgi:YHS domain-containing protein
MSVAGLVTEGIFQLAGLVPTKLRGDIAVVHLGWNYTTILNAIAVVVAAYLYWLYKNADRFGGGQGYAKDVVCGMQVRTSDAPARTTHDGHPFFFCSDKCLHKFESAPAKFAAGKAVTGMDVDHDHSESAAAEIDPVCGMTVRVDTAAGRATYAGRDYFFCSSGCQHSFEAAPLDHHEEARDPVCGMDVTVASPGATGTVDGVRYVFCMQGCADRFVTDPSRYLLAPAGERGPA